MYTSGKVIAFLDDKLDSIIVEAKSGNVLANALLKSCWAFGLDRNEANWFVFLGNFLLWKDAKGLVYEEKEE